MSHLILLTICANHFNLRFIEAECKVVCQSQTSLLLLTHHNVLQCTHPYVHTLVYCSVNIQMYCSVHVLVYCRLHYH